MTVKLPAGFTLKRLPERRQIEGPFGSFTLSSVESARGVVAVTGALTVQTHRIRQKDYPAFRRFCAEVDAAVVQELVLERTSPLPQTTTTSAR